MSKRKSIYKKPACNELCDSVGTEGLQLYRDIFKNNNKKIIAKFFADSLVKKLWVFVQRNLKFKNCFKRCNPNSNIIRTYSTISKTMVYEFGIMPPEWWLKSFPPL